MPHFLFMSPSFPLLLIFYHYNDEVFYSLHNCMSSSLLAELAPQYSSNSDKLKVKTQWKSSTIMWMIFELIHPHKTIKCNITAYGGKSARNWGPVWLKSWHRVSMGLKSTKPKTKLTKLIPDRSTLQNPKISGYPSRVPNASTTTRRPDPQNAP